MRVLARLWIVALASAALPANALAATASHALAAPGSAAALVQAVTQDEEDAGSGGDESGTTPVEVPADEATPLGGADGVDGVPADVTPENPEFEPVGRPPFADTSALESTEPVVSVVGTGAPEVLVWFDGERPGLEELTWRLGIASALGEQLEPGKGTVHVLVDTGQLEDDAEPQEWMLEYLIQHPGIGAVGTIQERSLTALRVRPPLPYERDLRAGGGRPFGGFPPVEVIRVGLGIEALEIDSSVATTRGAWLRHPDGGAWVWAPRTLPPAVNEYERWSELHAEELDSPITTGEPQSFPSFDSSELWPERVVKVVGDQRTTLSGDPVRPSAELAAILLERLVSPARVTMTLVGQPVHLGGELWQLDLALGAPALQPRALDPARTYPKARLSLPLSWSGKIEGASFPSLARVAWRAEGSDHFKVLAERGVDSGRYGFPNDDLPAGVTLRLVVEAPGASDGGRALNIGLDAGRSGRADLLVRLGASPTDE